MRECAILYNENGATDFETDKTMQTVEAGALGSRSVVTSNVCEVPRVSYDSTTGVKDEVKAMCNSIITLPLEQGDMLFVYI